MQVTGMFPVKHEPLAPSMRGPVQSRDTLLIPAAPPSFLPPIRGD